MPAPEISGVILLAHGSREPATEAEIKDLCAALVGALPGTRIVHAFLNQGPKLEAAIATLVAARCARIRVLPLLVFTGRHLTEDVPAEIARLRTAHPALSLELEPHLFRLPGFSALLADALNQPPGKETPA